MGTAGAPTDALVDIRAMGQQLMPRLVWLASHRHANIAVQKYLEVEAFLVAENQSQEQQQQEQLGKQLSKQLDYDRGTGVTTGFPQALQVLLPHLSRMATNKYAHALVCIHSFIHSFTHAFICSLSFKSFMICI